MSDWYWRDGTKVEGCDAERGSPQWINAMATMGAKIKDREYKVVKQETLANGKYISTVWLGLNHQWGDGPPLIFETMVFDGSESVDMERYSTEAEAIAGHEAMKARWL